MFFLFDFYLNQPDFRANLLSLQTKEQKNGKKNRTKRAPVQARAQTDGYDEDEGYIHASS
jgi:hypothetical protein